MVSIVVLAVMYLVTVLAFAWLLAGERRAHNRTLDRFMAVTETLGAYQARREEPDDDGELGWLDPETGEIRPVIRGNRSGVEDVAGDLAPRAMTEDSLA